ncbi:Forkhead-associated domain-containing protein 1, partial [Leptosomus discolor]
RDEQLKSMQEETELERQKLQDEVAEYKEQSKQHSLTIVALEDRLLEAKQQQQTLEEENAALVAKLEGMNPGDQKAGKPAMSTVRSATICLRSFREELAAAQSALLSKEAVIAGLTKELAETRARMSDLRGELSEEQKVELEQNVRRLKGQERELNVLRENLSRMSSLVEEKDRALKAAAEELRYRPPCPDTVQEPLCRFPAAGAARGKKQLVCFLQEAALDLADLGAKCRGLRHEETIRRQKEGLAELRERMKMLEKRQPRAAVTKGSEPLVLLQKDLPEHIVQKTGLEKESAPVSGTQLEAGKVPSHVLNGGSHGAIDGAASSEMGDLMDAGERMCLDVIGALGSLLKVRELSGMLQPLKHLPAEERGKAGLQRRKALELLYDKIRNLQSRLERKEEMLKEYKASMEQLR